MLLAIRFCWFVSSDTSPAAIPAAIGCLRPITIEELRDNRLQISGKLDTAERVVNQQSNGRYQEKIAGARRKTEEFIQKLEQAALAFAARLRGSDNDGGSSEPSTSISAALRHMRPSFGLRSHIRRRVL